MSGTHPICDLIFGVVKRVTTAALAVMIVSALSPVFTQPAYAQSYTETVLHSFPGPPDGEWPVGIVLDSQGNIYGATQLGGYLACGVQALQLTCGTVFKLDTTGQETVLYDFRGGNGDGRNPEAGLILDDQGNLYGTTVYGGDLSCNPAGGPYRGCGIVFKLDPSGRETVLHMFSGLSSGGDGALPGSALVEDGQGNLYGTTSSGGNGGGVCTSNGGQGCGTVFKLDPAGNETVLYRFTGTNGDGGGPWGGVVLDAQGNLYGATVGGGTYGYGTVFKLGSSGNETVLHSFRGVTEGQTSGDGAYPYAALVRDSQGNLYGTTLQGGNYGNCFDISWGCGTVFKVSASGQETVLYRFTGANGDGKFAYGTLFLDSEGNLYSTTSWGGAYGGGTAFKVDTSGHETVLYSFDGSGGGGSLPYDLVPDQQGNLYGAAYMGGASEYGTVFKLSPPGQH